MKGRVWDGGQTEMWAVYIGLCAECGEDDGVDCVEMVDVVRWCEGIAEKGRGAYQGGVGRVGIEIWTEGNEAAVGHWMLWRIPNVTAASISWLL